MILINCSLKNIIVRQRRYYVKGVDDAAERFDLGHDSHVSIVPDPLVFRAMDPECMELVLFADLNHYACCVAHHLFLWFF